MKIFTQVFTTLAILLLVLVTPFCVTANTMCNVTALSQNGSIIVNGLSASTNSKLFDTNIASVWECNPWNGSPCNAIEVIPNLTVGATYFLSVQSDECSEWIPIVVAGNGGCPDADDDGVCDDNDCEPNDPDFPTTPGSTCDDGSFQTTNDLIQSDGCTCEGTPVDSNNRPDLTISNISGLPTEITEGATYSFTYDLNNIGTADAAADYIVRFYLKKDPGNSGSTGTTSFNVGLTETGYTPALSSTTVQGEFTVPSDLLYESFYLVLRADATSKVFEDKEDNNYASSTALPVVGYESEIQISRCQDQSVKGSYTNSGNTIFWLPPNGLTNCTASGVTRTQISGPELNSFQSPGTYQVTYQFTDDCGNVENCTINVSVDEVDASCLDAIGNGNIDCSEYLSNGNYRVVANNNNNLTEYIYGTDGQLISSQGIGTAVTESYDVDAGNIVTTNGQGNITNQQPVFNNLLTTYGTIWAVTKTSSGYIFGVSNQSYDQNANYTIFAVETDLNGNILNETEISAGENFLYTAPVITSIVQLSADKFAMTFAFPTGNEPYGFYTGAYSIFDNNLQVLHTENTSTLNYATQYRNPGLRKTACGDFYMETGYFTGAAAGPINTIADSERSYYSFDGTKLNIQKNYSQHDQFYSYTQVNTQFTKQTRAIDELTPNGDQLVVNHEYQENGVITQVTSGNYNDRSENIIYLEHYSNGALVWSYELAPGDNYIFEEFILLGDKHFLLGTENNITYLIDLDCLSGTTPPITICDVNITSTNGTATITGLSSDTNTKLFDSSYDVAFQCNPWSGDACTALETVTGLTVGATYFLSVQSDLCDEWIPIVIEGGDGCADDDNDGICNEDDCKPNDPTLPAVPGSACNDFDASTSNDIILADECTCAGTPLPGVCNVSVTQSGGSIIISGLTDAENAKLFDATVSSSGIEFSCNPWNGNPCNGSETVSGLIAGATYYLSVQSDLCDEWIPITIQTGFGANNDLAKSVLENEDTWGINNVFPNPSHDELFLSIDSQNDKTTSLQIINVNGQLVQSKQLDIEQGQTTHQLDIQALQPGMYQLILIDSNNKITQTRFVKI